MHRTWFALALAPLLAACASVPDYRYYTLDMTPHAGVDVPLYVEQVRISVNEAIGKPEILIRTSPTRIEYYALDRWAGGLEEQVAEKLKAEFDTASGDSLPVSLFGRVMAFEQVDTPSGAEGRVKLEMTASAAGGEFTKTYAHSVPAGASSADSVVEALSRAMEGIAKELAADIQRFANEQAAHKSKN